MDATSPPLLLAGQAQPVNALNLGQLRPRQVIIPWSQAQAQVQLPLTNLTGAVMTVGIVIDSQTAAARLQVGAGHPSPYAFQPTLIELLPYEARQIPILIQPLRRPLLGFGQDHFFTLTVYSSRTGQQKSVLGQFRCKALLETKVMAWLALLLIVFFAAQRWITSPFEAPAVQSTAVTFPPATATPPWRKRIATHPPPTSTPFATAVVQQPQNDDPITYQVMFRRVADQYGLDWRILAAQAYYESQINPYALGQDHDMGLMQIIPATWAIWSKEIGIANPSPYDAYHNLLVAARYHQYLQVRLQAKQGCATLPWVLTAYNWGPHNVLRLPDCHTSWGDVPLKTRRYVGKILDAAGQPELPFTELQAVVPHSSMATD